MSEERLGQEDVWLRAQFRPLAAPIPDAGFSAAVERRVRRWIWSRRVVVGLASLGGMLLASGPLSQLLLALSQELTELSGQVQDDNGLIALLPVNQLLTSVGNRLVHLSGQLDAVAWFTQYRVLILGSLLALLTPAIVRVLED